jgi:hypothetical protein
MVDEKNYFWDGAVRQVANKKSPCLSGPKIYFIGVTLWCLHESDKRQFCYW